MSDNQDWLKLQLGTASEPVDADAFLSVLGATIDSLKALDRETSLYGSNTLRWQITEAGTNSPLHATIHAAPLGDSGDGSPVVALFASGVKHFNESRTCPPHFNKEVLKYIKAFGEVASREDMNAIVFIPIGEEIRVSRNVAKNADWALKEMDLKGPLIEYGSIEGTVKGLTAAIRGGDRIDIVDVITGEETHCELNRAELEDVLRDAWKKRVSVTGRIYIDRSTQQPIRIEVDDITILRDRSQLPQPDDLGIDITRGEHSAEYVRRLHDEE